MSAAESALVNGIYEIFYYRGLPYSPGGTTTADWNYDYGCLIAYDASPQGHLVRAWDSVVSKDCFWDGGNLFVMVLRGNGGEKGVK